MHVLLHLNGSIVRDNSQTLDLKRTFDPLLHSEQNINTGN